MANFKVRYYNGKNVKGQCHITGIFKTVYACVKHQEHMFSSSLMYPMLKFAAFIFSK